MKIGYQLLCITTFIHQTRAVEYPPYVPDPRFPLLDLSYDHTLRLYATIDESLQIPKECSHLYTTPLERITKVLFHHQKQKDELLESLENAQEEKIFVNKPVEIVFIESNESGIKNFGSPENTVKLNCISELPLQIATEHNLLKIVNWLLQNGANPNMIHKNPITLEGTTFGVESPLSKAITNKIYAEFLSQQQYEIFNNTKYNLIKLLLQSGANPNRGKFDKVESKIVHTSPLASALTLLEYPKNQDKIKFNKFEGKIEKCSIPGFTNTIIISFDNEERIAALLVAFKANTKTIDEDGKPCTRFNDYITSDTFKKLVENEKKKLKDPIQFD